MKSNYRYIKYVIVFLLAVLVIWGKFRQPGGSSGRQTREPAGLSLEQEIRSLAGNLSVSRHARCRMQCRHIDEVEVREVLESGIINNDRIEKSDKGISVPLEGETQDRQHVRIVVAPKENILVLVTVIDLDTDWPCECP